MNGGVDGDARRVDHAPGTGTGLKIPHNFWCNAHRFMIKARRHGGKHSF